jgi:hypothetical protein
MGLTQDIRAQYSISTQRINGLFAVDCEFEHELKNISVPQLEAEDEAEDNVNTVIVNKVRILFADENIYIIATSHEKGTPDFHTQLVDSFQLTAPVAE